LEEVNYLLAAHSGAMTRIDKIRLMGWPAPIGIFLYVLLAKGCLFDGWAGWYYALQRVVAEALIALEIIHRRLSCNRPPAIKLTEDTS
jgi:hypothetical protein